MVELLEDEKHILYMLAQYGPLLIPQLHKFLHNKTNHQQARIVKNLRRYHYAYAIGDGRYLGADPVGKPDPKNVDAVWVLLQFIDNIEPTGHFAANIPAQIFFMKDGIGYEIIVLYDDEDYLLRLVQPKKDTKYIIVIPDMKMAESIDLPDAPCLFATIEKGPEKEPIITFYSPEDSEE